MDLKRDILHTKRFNPMSFDNTHLTTLPGFDVRKIVFAKPRKFTQPVEYKRWPIGVKNSDGSVSSLIVEMPECYSFGLSENIKQETGKLDGYTLPLCLQDQQNPTDEQRECVDKFNEIIEHIKKYCVDHRDEIEKYELELADLKKMNPIYYKKEKGKIVDGAGPVLYAKVLEDKKKGTIMTPFSDKAGNDVDPMTLLNKHCRAKAALKFECVYVGAKVSVQIKIYEAQVTLRDGGMKRLLQKTTSTSKVEMDAKEEDDDSSPAAAAASADDAGSVQGSDSDSDDEEESSSSSKPAVAAVAASSASSSTPAAKPAARRIVRKA